MTTRDDGGPAFPCGKMPNDGMTLRDYFAAKAMQAFVADDDPYTHDSTETKFRLGYAAKYSYQMADAMLKAREGGNA